MWSAFPFRFHQSLSSLWASVTILHWMILRERLMEEMQSAVLPVSNQPRPWSGWGSVVVVGSPGLIMTLKCSFSLWLKWSEHSACQTCFLSMNETKEEERIKKNYINSYLRQSRCGGTTAAIDSSQQRQNSPHVWLFFKLADHPERQTKDSNHKNKMFFIYPSFQHLWSHKISMLTN